MPRDFVPRRDAEFLAFTMNFSQKIAASAAHYGLSPAQAAQYAITQDAFATAYDIAIRPDTRTTPAVTAKNDARTTLEDETRTLAAIIRAHPGVTATDLCDLQLCVPHDRRKRVPDPVVAPVLQIRSVEGAMINVQLMDSQSGGVGKPRDVAGAAVMGFVGDEYPPDPLRWTLVRQTTWTRLRLAVSLPPGQKIWLAACWLGTRGQRGPLSVPMSTYVSHDGPVFHAGRGLPTVLRFASAAPSVSPATELKQAA